MKPFRWGMINPLTGAPFNFDDANVQWGDPGFYLEPGDPGFVPYPGRDSCFAELPVGTDVMQALEKFTRDRVTAGGHFADECVTPDENVENRDDFSMSCDPEPELNDDAMDMAVSEMTGVPADKCAEVLGAYLDQLLACAEGSPLAQGIHELLTICPTSGGSASGKNGLQMLGDALFGAVAAQRGRRF